MQASTGNSDALFLTVLPNGVVGNSMRFTVVVTPSVTGDFGASAFLCWPASLSKAKELKWSLIFRLLDVPQPPNPPSPISTHPPFEVGAAPDGTPSALDPGLWSAIFGTNRPVSPRTASAELAASWRISHDITTLHKRHQTHQLFYSEASLLAKAAASAQPNAKKQIMAVHDLAAQRSDEYMPPALYIYPILNDEDKILEEQFADRKAALDYLDHNINTPANQAMWPKLQGRIQYALDLLEQNGEQLLAVALYALFLHCISSLRNPGETFEPPPTDPNSPLGELFTLYSNTNQQASGFSNLDVVGKYVELLLFHRRKPEPRSCANPLPDFHQLLGMVNHYPSLLRTLGLAFDLTVDMQPKGNYAVYAVPTEDGQQNTIGGVVATSNVTVCTVVEAVRDTGIIPAIAADFFTCPYDPDMIAGRMLSLANPDLFTLVSEDADGGALKLTDQTNSQARSKEYDSSAPTSMNQPQPYVAQSSSDPSVRTPTGVPDPTSAPPSSRTVGIALFHSGRLDHLESVIAKTTDVTMTPQIFYADDLVLGYRVDVLYKGKWLSLCQRKSCYDVYKVGTPNLYKTWTPAKGIELDADEGYVTFTATQTPTDDDQTETQTQIHHSVFTWTGWSLAVPKPNFAAFNPQADSTVTEDDRHLSIKPNYTLAKHSLPPLRFDTEYSFRCRVVDIGGNSVAVNTVSPDISIGKPLTEFSRQEPIRAPQFLLTDPIDRKKHPGEHIDHMVARDGHSRSMRILVPPRESLRLAELHGFLKSAKLPTTAFAEHQLLDDGSFPSVNDARNNGWVSAPNDDQGNRDAILLSNISGNNPSNPYYPDPCAQFIRIDAYLVSDDPATSKQLGDSIYLPIGSATTWPNYSAADIVLQPHNRNRPTSITLETNGGHLENRPGVTVNLPQGRTVVVRICSAACDLQAPDAKSQVCNVALFNLHSFFVTNTAQSATNASTAFAAMALDAKTDGAFSAQLSTVAEVVPDSLNACAFVNGSLETVTPNRTMTLVHAVKHPLDPPDFAPLGSAGDVSVTRMFGDAKAAIEGAIEANWLTTGKITCFATWTDIVDDIKKPDISLVRNHETAFDFSSADTIPPDQPDYEGSQYLRTLVPGRLKHAFRDTRAHKVTYSLNACSRFVPYYPNPTSDEEGFQVAGLTTRTITVLSSVRPTAPAIAYVIPAFDWTDTYDEKSKTWFSGRKAVLRIYLNRPCLGSGDREGIGIVLFSTRNKEVPADQPQVSRWGSDPTRPIVTPLAASELSAANFCEPHEPIRTCLLPTGEFADVKPCAIQYAQDRQLWFSDIPINTLGSYAPFLRLAVVRWQPDALHGATDDARVSQVVFADFIQMAVDRWASIERRSSTHYTVTVSGVFTGNQSSTMPTFTLVLYARWYALGKDTGWRIVDCPVQFSYTPASTGSNISSWSGEVRLPQSTCVRKYRVLLREHEWFTDSKISRVPYAQFVDLP
jgi:hypothetical protein